MINQTTKKASALSEDITQNASDTITVGSQISSDVAIGSTEYASSKVENVVHDFEDATADWSDENSKFATDQLVDMAETASLFGNLARSMSEQTVDVAGKQRLEQFGDPSAKVRERGPEEDYVPRRLQKYM